MQTILEEARVYDFGQNLISYVNSGGFGLAYGIVFGQLLGLILGEIMRLEWYRKYS